MGHGGRDRTAAAGWSGRIDVRSGLGADRRALALLFAGSDLGGSHGPGLAGANPIHVVLGALKIDRSLS